MNKDRKLSASEISERLGALDGWTVDGDRLHRSLTFPDFASAFGFMTTVALIAEQLGHHPDWHNVYNRVDVYLTTHDCGGISERDFELAARIDQIPTP
ncbi:MAG: 4a-hydroxytetrahydrobiopterin dehydratase [Candidatus Dadabacteria bacterium]|nr:MAG: 4a-hydroxytetrahydrobiopterin dehydratase [Candidatus Dadabacteria bacterium]